MKTVHLCDDVRVFEAIEGVIRFRKGIWNYCEAALDYRSEPVSVRNFYRRFGVELASTRKADLPPMIEEAGLGARESETVAANLTQLQAQSFLYDSEQRSFTRRLIDLLSFNFPGIENIPGTAPSVFLYDVEKTASMVKFFAEQLEYPVDRIDADLMDTLAKADLTSRTEAMEHLAVMERVSSALAPYAVVMGCFQRADITMLRNLNRVLIRLRKPSVLGFIDGPFLTVLCVSPPETGCFECFEHRVLARMEDTAAYERFVAQAREIESCGFVMRGTISPLMGMVVSLVLSEGFMMAGAQMNKTSGRILNIYLPTFEIQVQDLLRVPYCPACGNVAAATMDELYTSARTLVDRMLERIEVVPAGGERS